MTQTAITEPESPSATDPRIALFAAQEWATTLLANTHRQQWDLPTPCAAWNVEQLLQHFYGVADRLIAMGGGAPAESVPACVAELPPDVVAGFTDRVEQGRRAWSDPAALQREIDVPWGRVPAPAMIAVYTAEHLAHGWDLAVATGQPSEADPVLAEQALQTMRRVLPADGRADFPFDPPTETAPGAGPTERLVAWLGRGTS